MQESTTTMSDAKPLKPRRRVTLSRRNMLTLLAVLVLAGAIAYLFWQNMQLRSPEYQAEAQKRANTELIDRVSKVVVLPTDQEPTIATITKVDELKKVNATFYGDAQDGDKILFYSTRAVIYRESEGKIINIAPVTLDQGDQKGLESEKK